MDNRDKNNAKPEDHVRQYFAQGSGLEVCSEWKSELRAFRFYFQQKASDREWKYVLDVADQDVTAGSDVFKKLEAAAWLSRLKQESGKSVPLFENGEFSHKTHDWPAAYKYKRSS
jgi:hypothetical protein